LSFVSRLPRSRGWHRCSVIVLPGGEAFSGSSLWHLHAPARSPRSDSHSSEHGHHGYVLVLSDQQEESCVEKYPRSGIKTQTLLTKPLAPPRRLRIAYGHFGRSEADKLAPDTIIPSPPSGNRTENVSVLVPGKNPEVRLKEVRLLFQFWSGNVATRFPLR